LKENKLDIKKDMLKAIIKEMNGNEAEGLQKITVMAKDMKGLKKGLEKAEEVLPEEELCPECDNEGCEHCEEESDSKHEMLKKLMSKK
jgi:hypothetical protein